MLSETDEGGGEEEFGVQGGDAGGTGRVEHGARCDIKPDAKCQ